MRRCFVTWTTEKMIFSLPYRSTKYSVTSLKNCCRPDGVKPIEISIRAYNKRTHQHRALRTFRLSDSVAMRSLI